MAIRRAKEIGTFQRMETPTIRLTIGNSCELNPRPTAELFQQIPHSNNNNNVKTATKIEKRRKIRKNRFVFPVIGQNFEVLREKLIITIRKPKFLNGKNRKDGKQKIRQIAEHRRIRAMIVRKKIRHRITAHLHPQFVLDVRWKNTIRILVQTPPKIPTCPIEIL